MIKLQIVNKTIAFYVDDKGGWCRHHLNNGNGQYCIYGALARCTPYSDNQNTTMEIAQDLAWLTGTGSITWWNDNVAKDKVDVINLLTVYRDRLVVDAAKPI